MTPAILGSLPIPPLSNVPTPRRAQQTRWSFVFVCCFLAAQAYTVPILPIGPSWVLWPTLADIVSVVMVAALAWTSLSRTTPQGTHPIAFVLIILYAACLISYLVLTVSFPILHPALAGKSLNVGAFQLFRLTQAALVFVLTVRLPLTSARLKVLSALMLGVLLAVVSTIILDYFDIVRTSAYARHLPGDLAVSGYWSFYVHALAGRGLGTIGYNHSHVAIHVLTIAAIYLALRRSFGRWRESLLLMVVLYTIGLTESRTGFVVGLTYVTILIVKNLTRGTVLVIGLVAAIFVSMIIVFPDMLDLFSVFTTRHSTIGSSFENDGFSGRDILWDQRIAFLNEEPLRWFVGSGFGSSVESGNWAHMLYLTLLVEGGLVGVGLFGVLMIRIAMALRHESGARPILWLTFSLVVSSFTQETFYPVPAFGGFLSLYLCGVALAIQRIDVESRRKRHDRRYIVARTLAA